MGAQEFIKNEAEAFKKGREQQLRKPLSKRYIDFPRLFAFVYRSRFYPKFQALSAKGKGLVFFTVAGIFASVTFQLKENILPKRRHQYYQNEIQDLAKQRGWVKEN